MFNTPAIKVAAPELPEVDKLFIMFEQFGIFNIPDDNVASPEVPVVVKLVTTPEPPPAAFTVIVVPDGVVTEPRLILVPATSIGLYVESIRSTNVSCVIRSPLSKSAFN